MLIQTEDQTSNLDDIGLFDLDGSLADYELALRSDLAKLYPDPIEDLWDESNTYLNFAKYLIKMQPNWWKNLALIPAGFQVLKLAKQLGFDCQVLTKGPKRFTAAWTEKVEWCQQHLGSDVDIHVVSHKKVVYGKFLYDDYPDYMLSWLQKRPRGLGIMPVTEYNKDFKHPNVIMYDGSNLEAVEKALVFVKNRRPGEPLCAL